MEQLSVRKIIKMSIKIESLQTPNVYNNGGVFCFYKDVEQED